MQQVEDIQDQLTELMPQLAQAVKDLQTVDDYLVWG
jgi:hypothetical protein